MTGKRWPKALRTLTERVAAPLGRIAPTQQASRHLRDPAPPAADTATASLPFRNGSSSAIVTLGLGIERAGCRCIARERTERKGRAC